MSWRIILARNNYHIANYWTRICQDIVSASFMTVHASWTHTSLAFVLSPTSQHNHIHIIESESLKIRLIFSSSLKFCDHQFVFFTASGQKQDSKVECYHEADQRPNSEITQISKHSKRGIALQLYSWFIILHGWPGRPFDEFRGNSQYSLTACFCVC